jgi:hypothetical protein
VSRLTPLRGAGRPGQIVRKRATYECGCARAVDAVQGRPPRPPMECPDHGSGWERLETFELPPEAGGRSEDVKPSEKAPAR